MALIFVGKWGESLSMHSVRINYGLQVFYVIGFMITFAMLMMMITLVCALDTNRSSLIFRSIQLLLYVFNVNLFDFTLLLMNENAT